MLAAIICTVIFSATYYICQKKRTEAFETAQANQLELERSMLIQESNEDKEDSPFLIKRVECNGRWGYAIWDKRISDYANISDQKIEFFRTLAAVYCIMNEIETFENFKVTKPMHTL